MDINIKIIIRMLIVIVLSYGIMTFISLELNPVMWHEDVRFFFCMFSLVGCVAAYNID